MNGVIYFICIRYSLEIIAVCIQILNSNGVANISGKMFMLHAVRYWNEQLIRLHKNAKQVLLFWTI